MVSAVFVSVPLIGLPWSSTVVTVATSSVCGVTPVCNALSVTLTLVDCCGASPPVDRSFHVTVPAVWLSGVLVALTYQV